MRRKTRGMISAPASEIEHVGASRGPQARDQSIDERARLALVAIRIEPVIML
jgi:hypothetical protein